MQHYIRNVLLQVSHRLKQQYHSINNLMMPIYYYQYTGITNENFNCSTNCLKRLDVTV